MPSSQTLLSYVGAAVLLVAACKHSKTTEPVSSPNDSKLTVSAVPTNQEDLNRQILSALQVGRYGDAVEFTRRSRVSAAETDFAVGEIILQGHADAHAAQRPRETVEDGLRLIEAAALAGHQQAISSLAATFHTGVSAGTADAFLLSPDPPLNQCWESAKEAPRLARSCVEMRRKH